jgi:CelD/BcsL family acetyltransferase involved in cellulose biosynthesis
MVAIELIDDIVRLREFLPEWSRFLDAVLPPSPFQTPRWLLTWWSYFGSGKLHVLVFRHDAEIVGILPCFLHEWKGRRQLTLMGSGISDYTDPIFDPRYYSAIVEALESHLRTCAEWEMCDWQDLSGDTPLRALGPVVDDTPCSRIPLEESFEAFLAARPHGLKRNLRRYREKAQALGPLHCAVTADPEPALLTALIDLHRARWRRHGEPGVIDSNGAAEFLRQMAKAMAGGNMLRIFALHFEERVTAVVLALRNQSTIFSYLSAYDPEYESFGCGRELLARALNYAHSEGYRFWDFLRGDEPYKSTWGAQQIPKCRLRLAQAEFLPARQYTRPMP